jgi:excinuclease ABC subunit C
MAEAAKQGKTTGDLLKGMVTGLIETPARFLKACRDGDWEGIGREAVNLYLLAKTIKEVPEMIQKVPVLVERTRASLRVLRARKVALALQNAENALRMREATQSSLAEQFEELRGFLGLERPVERIECFDVSHTQGEATSASCVVLGPSGSVKADYRRYNIEGVEKGDDYGALRQALTRRYRRRKNEQSPLPDLLLIDGGAGQLAEANRVLTELELPLPAVAAVAKGADRRVGQERIFLLGRETPSILPADSKALHLIQRARDEAHRFAISGHRRKRARTRQTSMLEAVAGLGPARRRALLRQFGGLQGVLRAGVEDLARAPGIGPALAQAIYEHLHPGAG